MALHSTAVHCSLSAVGCSTCTQTMMWPQCVLKRELTWRKWQASMPSLTTIQPNRMTLAMTLLACARTSV